MNSIAAYSESLVQKAIEQNASDIHFAPSPKYTEIYFRIHGKRTFYKTISEQKYKLLLTYYKFTSGMDIGETRRPQNGVIDLKVQQSRYFLRLSTLPVNKFESLAIRILPQEHEFTLDQLFLFPNQLHIMKQWLKNRSGLILFTGPTGSGKTTTLYALLHHFIQERSFQTITLEDPVEKEIDHLLQVQVNEKAGITYQTGLKAALRHDPDIIMIGEIRDFETAQIAVRASLTGHLVLSTLHTNSAVAAVTRLIDMGVEPFLISSSLEGVVAQRLVRRVCRDCAEEMQPTEREKELFQAHGIEFGTIKRGIGCSSCNMTGYRGRLAIQEVLPVDDVIRDKIANKANMNDIREYAKSAGMSFLLQDGLLKVAQGLTTTEEVLRVAAID